jgi:hypothetical protein
MDTFVTVVSVAGLGGLLLAGGWAVHGLWRAVIREDRPVLMHRMLERQGLSMDRLESPLELVQAAAAARRCVMCRDRGTCLAWLERDGRTGYEAFCPNADFIARLRTDAAA